MTKRDYLSPRQRFEILKRDGFRCVYCGATHADSILHVDHVKPITEGGGNDPTNLVTACQACNGGKSRFPLNDGRITPVRTLDDVRSKLTGWTGHEPIGCELCESGSICYDCKGRDDLDCGKCGASKFRRRLGVYRILPKNDGEPERTSNLVVLCEKCAGQTGYDQIIGWFGSRIRVADLFSKAKNSDCWWWSPRRRLFSALAEEAGRATEKQEALDEIRRSTEFIDGGGI